MAWWFAQVYDRLTASEEHRFLDNARRALLADLTGDVIEIGAGTGRNFPYYPPAARVTATDRSPHMLRKAQRKLAAAQAAITLRRADTQALPFADAAFDHAVGTLVLCSVPEPRQALAEIARVTKPGGSVRLIEHVRSDRRWTARLQRALTPVWRIIGDGCHLDRDTVTLIREAGFVLESVVVLPHAPRLVPLRVIRARTPGGN